jgi:chemotaxis protein methyltransferase CheR
MQSLDIEAIEIDLLLEAAYRRYGYDFRSYRRASIERRLRRFLSTSGIESLSDITSRILYDEELFGQLVQYLSIPVTEMFRDPFVYRTFRRDVVPLLRTHPHLKIWHAGCATGEEVYSLAILLKEEGLYDRATIYATDFNDTALERAQEAIYPLEKIQAFTRNHQAAGGKRSFGDYYHARYEAAVLDPELKKRVTFANHNLATDAVFGEMHVIFCRNVLIYFDRELQDRAVRLFADSLVHGGVLCLGTKEDLKFIPSGRDFELLHKDEKIYKIDTRRRVAVADSGSDGV